MPYKRTRSAAAKQPDGNSSDVTDYMGPPPSKRKNSNAQSANISARMIKQNKTAFTRYKARQQRGEEEEEEEEDDDDGSVHVAFNQVSSAVNEARLGQPRTINGLQPKAHQAGPNGVTEDEDEEGLGGNVEGEAKESDAEGSPGPGRKRGQPVTAKQTKQQDLRQTQQSRPNTRSRAKAVGSADSIFDVPNTSQGVRTPRREASALGHGNGTSTPRQTQQRNQTTLESNKYGQQHDRASAYAGKDGEQNMQGAAAQVAEDSAFIDAPHPDEKLPQVSRAVNNLGGMIKTLRHPAWTGMKKWDDDPEMACSTKTGGRLIECLRQLNDLLVDACDARYEGDADGDPAVTINYLRRNNSKARRLFADITWIIDLICTEKLAAVDNLGARDVKTRKRFLNDIAKRLIPMLVLVIQKAYEVGPSENKGSIVHLTLNSFTIQFPLRTTGWATRLVESLSRGLTHWPIDDEFGQSDEELDLVELEQKQAKTKNRELFGKQLASLYLTVKNAAYALEMQAKQAETQARQEQTRRRASVLEEQHRRQAMIRGRELWAENERQRQEAKRKEESQMRKFAHATQALKALPDPLAVLWTQAVESGTAPSASWASVSSPDVPVPVPRRSKGKEKAVLSIDDNVDFFLTIDNDDHPLGSSVQNNRGPGAHRPQSGVVGRENGLQLAPATEVWGAPMWSKIEEKRLVLRMKYDGKYDPSSMASRLRRSAEDVARKAVELKAVYRAIYTKRGVDMPAWVL